MEKLTIIYDKSNNTSVFTVSQPGVRRRTRRYQRWPSNRPGHIR